MGLQHIGIPVTDINLSRSFYEQLGFQAGMTAAHSENGEPVYDEAWPVAGGALQATCAGSG